MVKEEIDKGFLENVLFIRSDFKDHLLKKNFFLILVAGLYSLTIFGLFVLSELIAHEFSLVYFYQFLVGIIVGTYYIFL